MPKLPWIQRACALALLLSAACSGASASAPEGGQTGGEEPPGACNPSSGPITPLDPNTKGKAGFSANDLLEHVASLEGLPFTYATSGSSTLGLDTSYVGPAGSDVCAQLNVGVSIHFATADAAFDETLAGTLLASRATQAGTSVRVMRSALRGNYGATHAASAAAEGIQFDVSFSNGTAHGTVLALGTLPAGSTPIIATF